MTDFIESAAALDAENRKRLEGLMRLTLRMDSLLDSLLHFSRVGRAALDLQNVDLNEVVEEALEIVAARRQETPTDIVILRPLPTMSCDRTFASVETSCAPERRITSVQAGPRPRASPLIAKLIDDLLDLSRITSGKVELDIESVDLNQTVRQVCESYRWQMQEKSICLETELHDAPSLITADSTRLQQVLRNLLQNAMKFTPEKGAIRVTTVRQAGGCWELRVQDTGVDISAEALPHIFDAFEQGGAKVTRQYGGLGLGLSICKALVELHGGSIRAESAGPTRGSTFIIELPGQAPDTPTKPPSQLLQKAETGLPDGDGYQLMRRIRAIRSVPGIAMSGYAMNEDRRRSQEAGFSEHLVKPIDIPQLIAALRRVTDGRPFVV